MAKSENGNNVGTICVLLLFVAIILIIIYFYNSRRYVKNVGVVSSQPMIVDQMDNPDSEHFVDGEHQSTGEHHNMHSMGESGPQAAFTEPGINSQLEVNAGPVTEGLQKMAYTDPTGTTGTSNTPDGGVIGQNLQGSLSKNKAFQKQRKAGCFPKEQLNPEELLPQDNANTWAQVNPTGSGTLKDKNFLQAGHHIGVNTVGQTLRNANMQLRSEPPNPQVKVSPWLQTTIEPDVNRKPLEIGGCA